MRPLRRIIPDPIYRRQGSRRSPPSGLVGLLLAVAISLAGLSSLPRNAFAQLGADQTNQTEDEELVSLDFADVELPVVIDTISRMTGYNFIYDDRVRGRVTIVSPTEVTLDQAFAVVESVLTG